MATTCDFLDAPQRYAAQSLELTGVIVRLRNGDWQFETFCGEGIKLPLRWASGVEVSDGIIDLSRPGDQIVFEKNTVAGRIVSGGGGRWMIEATDYFKARYTM